MEVPIPSPVNHHHVSSNNAASTAIDKKLLNKKKAEDLLNSKSAALIKPTKDSSKPKNSQSKEVSIHAQNPP